MKPTEKQLQDSFIDFLRMKGYYVMRLNSGMIPIAGNSGRRLVRLLPAGTPDLLAIKYGKCLFVEVKRPGNKPTELQKMKIFELQEYGAKCIVATCIEDIEEVIVI